MLAKRRVAAWSPCLATTEGRARVRPLLGSAPPPTPPPAWTLTDATVSRRPSRPQRGRACVNRRLETPPRGRQQVSLHDRREKLALPAPAAPLRRPQRTAMEHYRPTPAGARAHERPPPPKTRLFSAQPDGATPRPPRTTTFESPPPSAVLPPRRCNRGCPSLICEGGRTGEGRQAGREEEPYELGKEHLVLW